MRPEAPSPIPPASSSATDVPRSARCKAVDSPANGMTLCSGSLGARPDNELPAIMSEFGANKVGVIKVIREITGLGLKEAKELVEGVPSTVKEGVSKAEAEEIAAKLKEAGAEVEIA